VAEPAAVDEIIVRSAGLPLALAVAAARAVTKPALSLAELAAELNTARTGLDGFASTDTAIDARTVFSSSYHALSTEAATLFRLLGLHPGPDMSTAAVASLAGRPVAQVQPLLEELAAAHLLSEHVPHRYALHDLLRAYASEMAERYDSDDERTAAMHRMFDHYLNTAGNACRPISHAMRIPFVPMPLRPGVTVADFTDLEQAISWLNGERPVLLAMVNRAARLGFDRHTWHLAATLTAYLNLQGHWHDWVSIGVSGLEATRRLGDRLGEAYAHRTLAHAVMQLGQR
jgi:hypothetical protein